MQESLWSAGPEHQLQAEIISRAVRIRGNDLLQAFTVITAKRIRVRKG
jgi:hypothetical protein